MEVMEKSLNILIVDDELPITKIMTKILSKTGYKNVTAVNYPKEVFPLINKEKYDVIFLDMMLPEMRGDQIYEEIRKIDKNVIVIFMSGQVDFSEAQIKKLGVYAFLQKPFDVTQIVNLLGKIERL